MDIGPNETGLALKVERVAADVSSSALAEAMGVTVSRLSYIEGRRKVTSKAATKYRAALQTLTTKSSETTSAA